MYKLSNKKKKRKTKNFHIFNYQKKKSPAQNIEGPWATYIQQSIEAYRYIELLKIRRTDGWYSGIRWLYIGDAFDVVQT